MARVHITVPDGLLAHIDTKRGLIPRSTYLVDLIMKAHGYVNVPEVKEPDPVAEAVATRKPPRQLVQPTPKPKVST
jgi:hypothetical protein